jgi:cation diffusion facilitator CzcD-associated flavoprotein CzcO
LKPNYPKLRCDIDKDYNDYKEYTCIEVQILLCMASNEAYDGTKQYIVSLINRFQREKQMTINK